MAVGDAPWRVDDPAKMIPAFRGRDEGPRARSQCPLWSTLCTQAGGRATSDKCHKRTSGFRDIFRSALPAIPT
jgi:hypothetical protein